MAIGLRIRDPATGTILMDSTTAMVRLLDTFTIPGSADASRSGSIQVADFASGTPWISLYQGATADPIFLHQAQASVTGTTLKWISGQKDAKLLYGVYAGSTPGRSGSGQIGVRIANGNQATQIDSFFQNFAFVSKQPIYIVSQGMTTVTYTGGYPIIAYRGTGTLCVGAISVSGSTWTISLYSGFGQNVSGTIYIFDSVLNAQTFGTFPVGLRIRNRATGQVTYDSRARYMKIYRVAANPSQQAIPANPHTEVLPVDNLAFVANLPGTWWTQYEQSFSSSNGMGEEGGGVQSVYTAYMCGGGVNGTLMTTQSISIYAGSSDAIVADDSDTQYTLLDVTGL